MFLDTLSGLSDINIVISAGWNPTQWLYTVVNVAGFIDNFFINRSKKNIFDCDNFLLYFLHIEYISSWLFIYKDSLIQLRWIGTVTWATVGLPLLLTLADLLLKTWFCVRKRMPIDKTQT